MLSCTSVLLSTFCLFFGYLLNFHMICHRKLIFDFPIWCFALQILFAFLFAISDFRNIIIKQSKTENKYEFQVQNSLLRNMREALFCPGRKILRKFQGLKWLKSINRFLKDRQCLTTYKGYFPWINTGWLWWKGKQHKALKCIIYTNRSSIVNSKVPLS